ncbi:MAG: hypothetical protein HPY53_04210 [Brevinematales bacterium]|nr:hypothetical protein [Brevinematales bacterium]
MFAGMIILLVGIYVMLGGITPAHQKLTELKPALTAAADTPVNGLAEALSKKPEKAPTAYDGVLDAETRLGNVFSMMTNLKANHITPGMSAELKAAFNINLMVINALAAAAPTNVNLEFIHRYTAAISEFNKNLDNVIVNGGGTNEIKGLIKQYVSIALDLKMMKNPKMGVPAGGWTSSPPSGSPLWWLIFSTIVFGVGIGVLAQPQLVVRFMTVKSNKELNRAVMIGAIFILVTVGTAYIVGSLTNVYFFEKSGSISVAYVGGNHDQVIPSFIASALPEWFGYIFMLVILSAGMSTLSSQFHTIGTSFGRDFFENGLMVNVKEKDAKKDAPKHSTVKTLIIFGVSALVSVGLAFLMAGMKMQAVTIVLVLAFLWMIVIFFTIFSRQDKEAAKMKGGMLATRIGIVVGILLTVILGLKLEEGIIARATAIFFGLMASSFLAPYTCAIFWKRLTRKGAIAGIISGVGTTILSFVFLHEKEAAYFGICKALTGKPVLIEGTFASVDPLVFGLPVSIIFTILISLLTKVENPSTVTKAFGGIGKK